MYINKVVFIGQDDLEREEKVLQEIKKSLLQYTDYGTVEITSDRVNEVLEEAKDPCSFNYSAEVVKEGIKELLGEDLTDLLISGEVDFCLVVQGEDSIMVEEMTKYVILARRKTSGGSEKGGVVLYEGREFHSTMRAFTVLSSAYQTGVINRGAYNLEIHEQVVPRRTPYMVKSSKKLCSMKGGMMYWS